MLKLVSPMIRLCHVPVKNRVSTAATRGIATFPRRGAAQAVALENHHEDFSPSFVEHLRFEHTQFDEFWRKIPLWQNINASDFMSYRWTVG
jgi:hypothetical protein